MRENKALEAANTDLRARLPGPSVAPSLPRRTTLHGRSGDL